MFIITIESSEATEFPSFNVSHQYKIPVKHMLSFITIGAIITRGTK